MRSLLVLLLMFAISAAGVCAQEQPKVVNPGDLKLAELPNAPKCARAAVLNGDPAKGASAMMVKFTPGCTVPLHWHTPNEQLIVVSGTGKLTPHPGKPTIIRAGGYAYMPSKHHHAFTCNSACTFFLTSDGVFDLHYVDESGKEISPEQALKSSKKSAKK